jgi:hypothetical protein
MASFETVVIKAKKKKFTAEAQRDFYTKNLCVLCVLCGE